MDSTDGLDYDNYTLGVMRQLLKSCIVSLFIESLFFGAFTIPYTMGMWSLLRLGFPGTPSRRDWAFALASSTMFVLALVHLALSLRLSIVGFVSHAGSLESVYDALDDASVFFDNTLGSCRFAIYVTQTLIGDGFMIYRLYIVWSSNLKVVILPAVLLVIGTAAGYVSVVNLFGPITPLVFFGLSFFTNILSTILIMWRILRSAYGPAAPKLMTRRFSLKYRKVVEAIVQSAAIYSTASISLCVMLFVSPNVGFYACLGVFPSLMGLVFSFIILRLSRRSRELAPHVIQRDKSGENARGAGVLSLSAASIPARPRPPSFPPPRILLDALDGPDDVESTRLSLSETVLVIDQVHTGVGGDSCYTS
ncbi:hypothetical protein BD414DRAFT_482116 [Trametes punicea]|nr:hypothetical protein BD414DRAFT_482116 [Trametes punicea]